MNFIPVAIAHDATCKKGKEWMFHRLPKENYDHLDPKLPDESKEEANGKHFWIHCWNDISHWRNHLRICFLRLKKDLRPMEE